MLKLNSLNRQLTSMELEDAHSEFSSLNVAGTSIESNDNNDDYDDYGEDYNESDDWKDWDDWDDQRTWGQKEGLCDTFDNCFACPYVDECF